MLPNSSLLVAIPLLSPAREFNEQRINMSEQKKTPLSTAAVAALSTEPDFAHPVSFQAHDKTHSQH